MNTILIFIAMTAAFLLTHKLLDWFGEYRTRRLIREHYDDDKTEV